MVHNSNPAEWGRLGNIQIDCSPCLVGIVDRGNPAPECRSRVSHSVAAEDMDTAGEATFASYGKNLARSYAQVADSGMAVLLARVELVAEQQEIRCQ